LDVDVIKTCSKVTRNFSL